MMKKFIRSAVTNAKGWRTSRKIVVIESDDWGTVRTSSKEALDALRNYGIPVEKCHYMCNDSLASDEDLTALFEVVSNIRNRNGEHPVITADCLVANPDFEKIKASGYNEYHYETVEQTLSRYPKHKNAFALWKEGIDKGLFYPQFHGREHVNLSRWMHDLQNEDQEALFAFELGMFGVSGHISTSKRGSYMAAFDGGTQELTFDRAAIINDGLRLFKETFGFDSKSIIAPNYIWDDVIEEAAFNSGVLYIQGSTVQRLPRDSGDPQVTRRHFLGEKNTRGQRYLVRNVYFEPSENLAKDWVNESLKEISNAFLFRKPAIISSHRVNFVGFINEANRDNNLKQLSRLLQQVVKRWPDVEFMTSDQLGEFIASSK